MKRRLLLFCLLLLFAISTGCAKTEAPSPAIPGENLAVLVVADRERQQLSPGSHKDLQRVLNWMDRDMVDLLRHKGFETVLLDNIKNYSSDMGLLFIINVEFFNPGATASLPKGRMGNPVSALDLGYRLLDERGALLAEWQDGENSRKGGTYCARTLNRRAADKLVETIESR